MLDNYGREEMSPMGLLQSMERRNSGRPFKETHVLEICSIYMFKSAMATR